MPYDGNTKYDCHAAHFSQEEACLVLGEGTETLNNWIRVGYLKPTAFIVGPRRTPLKRYSIVDITRAALIASCVNHAGLRPKLAAEIADFCGPIVNEHFERDAAGDRISDSIRLVISQLQRDGRLVSWAAYRRRGEHHFYLDDPVLNPDAQPRSFPIDYPCIVVPLTDMFYRIFISATSLLAKQQRGGLDKFRRPIDA